MSAVTSVVRRSRALITAVVLTLLASCEASRPELAAPRLVILYAPCSVNKDYLYPYAAGISYTPNLTRFAADSVLFSKHDTESAQSGIAYASLFSGSQADRHGVYRHPRRLEDELYLAAEAYAGLGYETFYWNDHPMASSRLNYAQGVDEANVIAKPLRARNPRFRAMLARLRAEPDYRVFVIANSNDAHNPYSRRPLEDFRRDHPSYFDGIANSEIDRFATLYERNHFGLSWNFEVTASKLDLSDEDRDKLAQVVELLYRANMYSLDAVFGDLLEAIEGAGLESESLIALTADHGQVLFRENALFKWGHSMQLAPDAISIPLIIRAMPRTAGGRSYAGVSRSIDVLPTLLGLTGDQSHRVEDAEGLDLSKAMLGIVPEPNLKARSHTSVLVDKVLEQMQLPQFRENWALLSQYFPSDDPNHIWVRIRDAERVYKLRRNLSGQWAVEAYDAELDPTETRNLYDASRPEDARMASELDEYKRGLVTNFEMLRSTEGARRLDEATEAAELRALGYIQ